jgi:hypothetical protein
MAIRHEIKLTAVDYSTTGTTVTVELELDGATFGSSYDTAEVLQNQHADLIPSPDQAFKLLLFYFLAMVSGDATKLGTLVGKTLTIDVRNSLQQITAIS